MLYFKFGTLYAFSGGSQSTPNLLSVV